MYVNKKLQYSRVVLLPAERARCWTLCNGYGSKSLQRLRIKIGQKRFDRRKFGRIPLQQYYKKSTIKFLIARYSLSVLITLLFLKNFSECRDQNFEDIWWSSFISTLHFTTKNSVIIIELPFNSSSSQYFV